MTTNNDMQAANLASSAGTLLQNMGFDSDKAAEETVNLTELASDMASFNNHINPNHAFEKLRSAVLVALRGFKVEDIQKLLSDEV